MSKATPKITVDVYGSTGHSLTCRDLIQAHKASKALIAEALLARKAELDGNGIDCHKDISYTMLQSAYQEAYARIEHLQKLRDTMRFSK